MSTNPPSFRFPFASLGKLPPEAQSAHLATFNALTDIYQSLTQIKQGTSSTTEIVEENVSSSSSSSSSSGVTSFNGNTGDVTYFPNLFFVNDQTGETAYTTTNDDNGAIIILDDSSAIAVSLNYTVSAPWAVWIFNYGTGLATLTPANIPSPSTSTITYPNNIGASSMPLAENYAALIIFDGQNFWGASVPMIAVTSLNGLSGALSLTSTGGTVSITPSGSTIDLETTGYPKVAYSAQSTTPTGATTTITSSALPIGVYRVSAYAVCTAVTGVANLVAVLAYTDSNGAQTNTLFSDTGIAAGQYGEGSFVFYNATTGATPTVTITPTGTVTYIPQTVVFERLV